MNTDDDLRRADSAERCGDMMIMRGRTGVAAVMYARAATLRLLVLRAELAELADMTAWADEEEQARS